MRLMKLSFQALLATTAIMKAYVATGNTSVLRRPHSANACSASHSVSGTGSGNSKDAAQACHALLKKAHAKLRAVLG